MDEAAPMACYEIRVRGQLGETLLGAFPDLHAQAHAAETVLTGELPDQAALHAVLAQIEALGLELLGLRRTDLPVRTLAMRSRLSHERRGTGNHPRAAVAHRDLRRMVEAVDTRLIRCSDPQAATAALAPVIAGSVPADHPIWLVEALLLEATGRDALGDADAAGRALERTLKVVEPGRVLLPFLHPAPKLLECHAWQRTAHADLLAEILSLLAETSSLAAPPGEPRSPREPLSQAETRVLRYLPTNLTVPEIAQQLSLSVHTIRTHLRHVYDKLGAHSRTEAVEQARALGLLAPSRRI